MSLLDLLARHEDERPDELALVCETGSGDPEAWTYRRLLRSARAVAAELEALGVRRGDRVAVFMGNRPEMVTAFLGLLELGVAMVPINLAYRGREIGHIVRDSEPRLVLTDDEHATALDGLVAPDHVVRAARLAGATSTMREAPRPEDESGAMILYTSGTTGRSKGAVLSHANVRATILALLDAWAWSADDVLLLTLPLFHTHGLVVGLLCALAAGATVDLRRRFEASAVVDALTGELPDSDLPGGDVPIRPRPTLFFGVPTMYVRLIDELGRREAPDLSTMRLFCSGSAPLDPKTFADFETLTGRTILERYGMTEAGMLLSNPYEGPRRPGTVGFELPGVTARVVDEEGTDGDAGELLVHGKNVFGGYWRDPGASTESFVTDEDGRTWFRTGDLARRDPETGYYTLLGRRHEMVISGGFNVYPREVEEVLTSLEGVREAAVVGRPHPEWGERVVAFLVADGSIDEQWVIDECKARMANFKVPRRIHRLDALPRNALGKVQKHRLPD